MAQSCTKENYSATPYNYALACTGTYPAACGGGAGNDKISCYDGYNESAVFGPSRYGGITATSYNSSVTNCSSITQVYACYGWYMNNSGSYTCTVQVSANGGSSFVNVTTTCPGTSDSFTCTNVTSLQSWTCGNFFGPSGTRAIIRDQINKSGSANHGVFTDALFFNVTYNVTGVSPSPAVSVALNSPGPSAVIGSSPADFNFTATTNNASTTLDCILHIDGAANSGENAAVESGVSAIISSSVAPPGSHAWNVTCTDASTTSNTSATRSFTSDLDAPQITLNSPADMNLTNDASIFFNFTTTDDASSTLNCSLWVDGSQIVANPSVTTGANWSFGATLSEGQPSWYIQCIDQGNHSSTSETRHMTVDLTAPAINISSPANFEMQNTTGVLFNYTPTDNFASTMSCSLYADDGLLGTFSVDNNTPRSDTYYFDSGQHSWDATCTDQAGNTRTTSTQWFTINLPPSVVLNEPGDNTWITSSDPVNVSFTFTPYDDAASLPSSVANVSTAVHPPYCKVYLDGGFTGTYHPLVNNTPVSFNQTISLGVHTWYVQCWDASYNTGTSVTYTLTVAAEPPPPPSSSSGGGAGTFSLTASALGCPGDTVDVYAYTSSGALAGANVNAVLSDPYEGVVAQGTTDSSGHVIFTLSSSGDYDFKATKNGYNNKQVSLQFTSCEQPPPPVTQPPTPQTHLACVNEACTSVQGAGTNTCAVDSDCVTAPPPVQPPANQTNPDTQGAEQAISAAQSAISDAQSGGKDVSGAMAKLAQAQSAFASGDYSQAKALADEAKQLALGAAAPPPAPAPKPAASSVVTPTPTPSGGIPLLLLLLIGAVIVVVAGAGAYLMFGKKKKPYK